MKLPKDLTGILVLGGIVAVGGFIAYKAFENRGEAQSSASGRVRLKGALKSGDWHRCCDKRASNGECLHWRETKKPCKEVVSQSSASGDCGCGCSKGKSDFRGERYDGDVVEHYVKPLWTVG